MLTRPLKQCNRDLNFSPRKAWPVGLPPYCWGAQLLCGFEHSHEQAIDLQNSNQNLAEVFWALYPQLKIDELVRAKSKLDEVFGENEFKKILKHQASPFSSKLASSIGKLQRVSHKFLTWCGDKDFSVGDLQTLNALNDTKLFNHLVEEIPACLASKSQGAQIVELLVELLLLDYDINTLKQNSLSAKAWVDHLNQLRFPMSHTRQQQKTKFLQSSELPLGVEGQWNRRGDKTGLTVKFFASSNEEFIRKMGRLQSWAEKSNEKVDELWK